MTINKFANLLFRIKTTFLFLSIILTLSCSEPNKVYVISKEDSLRIQAYTRSDGTVLMPPKAKYAIYTFVIDSNHHTYFYCFPEEKPRGGVFDEEPELLGLMPNQVFIIPRNMEEDFFKSNVLFQKSSRPVKDVILASFTDTISGDFYKYLKDVSSDKSNKVSLSIRLALPEERKVISCKIKGIYYEPIK